MRRSDLVFGFTSVSPMNEQHRNLVLMRHAKSAYPDGVADYDRPLAPRGIREARLAGEWLRANVPTVDSVLCSTATRTRETLVRTGIDAPVRYAQRLYGATPGAVIEEINRVADEITTLLVIGHEPTTSALALILATADSTKSTVAQRISEKFPTSAIAVLRIEGRWEDLRPGDASLVAFHVPREA
ncbi:Phosphohistidine phosphatase SixA [Mycobacterium persicum]|uniref:Phosphohistidine phosphatase SixA n=2 Tax=Mycobacterium persicum TaxID=1487726 RepID=A0AB38UXT2_9MYCO|nr:Phosphohistidine phosphatase SixA [Mycobacterium persicum]VAZ85101.1 Phosphohistidine phosphatase SixA [Mycobacterium persicum]VAZ97488.1 Phosphohistidine phosphatase SixA [Mycobacterium persicum]